MIGNTTKTAIALQGYRCLTGSDTIVDRSND